MVSGLGFRHFARRAYYSRLLAAALRTSPRIDVELGARCGCLRELAFFDSSSQLRATVALAPLSLLSLSGEPDVFPTARGARHVRQGPLLFRPFFLELREEELPRDDPMAL